MKKYEINNQSRAILAVLLGAATFSLGDAIVKFVSVNLVLWQILTLRAVLAIPILVIICRIRQRPIPLMPKKKIWTFMRSILMVVMWLTYYGALIYLPVTVAASVYYTMPIFLTLLAALLIGEKVTKIGWSAVFLGFLGVIITIQPDRSGFNLFTLLPLSSAIFFAFAMLITRIKIQDEHPFVLTINLQFCFLIAGLIGAFMVSYISISDPSDQLLFFVGAWKTLDQEEWLVVAILAIAITIGNILTSIAYQNGKPVVIGTLSYSYIPFVGLWGYLFFSEVPNISTIVGVILIAGAGFITLRA